MAHQRLAPFLLVGRPRRGRRRITHRGHDQHLDRRGLAVAAPAGSDEEAGPVVQQRTLHDGERGGDQHGLAGFVGGDVYQPLIEQELDGLLDALRACNPPASG